MILSAIMITLAVLSPAQENQFQAGLDAYWRGDYAQAVSNFEILTQEHDDIFGIWYNYGTALGRQGKTGEAVYAFERALLLKPGDVDAAANLVEVKRRAIDALSDSQQEEQLILPALERDSASLFRRYTSTTLNLIFALCWFFFMGALLMARTGTKTQFRTIGFFFTLVFFLLSMGVATLRFGKAYWVDDLAKGVVVTPLAQARQGPGKQYRSVAKVMDGVKVSVLGVDGGWTLIELNAGRTAWLKTAALATLPTQD